MAVAKIRVFLEGLATGALVALMLNPVPAAAHPYGCWNAAYNVLGRDGNEGSNPNQRGIRVRMYTYSADECLRTSSIAILGPNDSALDRQVVEFGWTLGWDCEGENYDLNQVRVFMVWDRLNGSYHCDATTRTLSLGSSYLIRLSDADANSIWNGYLGWDTSDEIKQVDMGFTYGEAITNSERENTTDHARAEFQNIEEYQSSNGWTNFDDVDPVLPDNDPGYVFNGIDPNHHTVIPG